MNGSFGHVGVLMGGCSSERPISLKSGQAVYEALKSNGCRVSSIDILDEDEEKIIQTLKSQNINLAFIALHGRLGEDGRIQSILEKLNIPYTGSGVQASQIALHKGQTQTLLKKNGIPVASFVIVSRNNLSQVEKLIADLGGFPVVVKPTTEGSSIGVSVVRVQEELPKAIDKAFERDDEILIEKYIKGREMTVGILGHQALAVIEVVPQSSFFDFEAKYQSGTTQYVIPAKIPEDVAANLQSLALRAFSVLGCRHLSRVDFMIDEKMNPYLLEINTIPGFTATSLLPKAARLIGLDFSQLCLKLIQLAYENKK